MRHAQAKSNVEQHKLGAQNGLHDQYVDYNSRWTNSSDLVDATLSDLGESQCLAAGQQLKAHRPGIKLVLVSPLRRAVQTAVLSLADYPGPLQWKAFPWFREILLSQCDLGLYSVDHLKNYPFIDSSSLKDDKLWFLDHYIDLDGQNSFVKDARKAYESNPCDQSIIDTMVKCFPDVETPAQMIARVKKFREELAAFLEEKASQGQPVKDGELLLVGHSRMLKFIFGVFTETGEINLDKEVHFANTDIKAFDFEY